MPNQHVTAVGFCALVLLPETYYIHSLRPSVAFLYQALDGGTEHLSRV